MIIDGIKRAAMSHPAVSLGGAALVGSVALVGGAPALLGSALVGAAVAATAKVVDSMRDGVFQDHVSLLERRALAAGIDPQEVNVCVDAGVLVDRPLIMPLSTLIDAKDLIAAGRGSGFANNARCHISEAEALRVIGSIEDRAQKLMEEFTAAPIKMATSGRYMGRIAGVKDGIAMQKVSPTSFVGHSVDKLSEVPQRGALLDIQYQRDGRGTVTDMNARKTDLGQSRGR